jgi:xanthine/uracil permease
MPNIIQIIKTKLNHIMWTFIVTGVVMLMLSVLTVWTDLVLRLLVGLFILLIALNLLSVAIKIHSIKKHLG